MGTVSEQERSRKMACLETNRLRSCCLILLCWILIGLGACRDCDARLVPYCDNQPCYPGPDGGILVGMAQIPGEAHRGQCVEGTTDCDAAGNLIGCIGAITPVAESCNGLDDDCDGIVDQQAKSVSDSGDVCTLCAGHATCINSNWTCVPLKPISSEICDGLDNDCNGEVDDGIVTEYAYPEDLHPNTVGVGECSPSITRCVDGAPVVTPAVIPRPETCNGLDDDCNGLVDDGLGNGPAVAFVINVDIPEVEGSSSVLLSGLVRALCQPFPIPGAFALIEFGNNAAPYPFVRLDLDFTDSQSTCDFLSSPFFANQDSELEFAYDGMLLIEELNWPPSGDPWAYLISDEDPFNRFATDFSSVAEDCQSIPYQVGGFQDPFQYGMADLVSKCGGFEDLLTYDADQMTDEFRQHLLGDCQ